MRVVVDTNVIAYYLLGTQPFRAECVGFWHAIKEPLAPASWEAELANVLWKAIRSGITDVRQGLAFLDLANELSIRSVAVSRLWHGALARACDSGVAAYDALFVELAERESVPLATYDARLLKTFPGIAKRPAALMKV